MLPRVGKQSCVVAILAMLGGCDIAGPLVCTTDVAYGVVVSAADEEGVGVQEGLQGVTIRGSRSDPMEVFGNTLLGAAEQAGLFDVVVTAPGYEIWTRTGVRVRQGECHVVQVQLDAVLVRVEPSAHSVRSMATHSRGAAGQRQAAEKPRPETGAAPRQ